MEKGIRLIYRDIRGVICDRVGVTDIVGKVIERNVDYDSLLGDSRYKDFVPVIDDVKKSKLSKEYPLEVPNMLRITVPARAANGTPALEDVPNMDIRDWVAHVTSTSLAGDIVNIYPIQDRNAAKRPRNSQGSGAAVKPTA